METESRPAFGIGKRSMLTVWQSRKQLVGWVSVVQESHVEVKK